jgi:hypothetical protein
LRVIPDDEFGGCCFYLRFGVGDQDVFCLRFKGGCDSVWSWSLLLWLVVDSINA